MIIIEFQGFCFSENNFVPKEICVLGENVQLHFIINSPKKFLQLNNKERCIVNWNEKNYHGLLWECGEIEWDECVRIIAEICADEAVFYVKGLEKAKFLRNTFGKNCIDVSSLGCPNIRDFRDCCEHHTIKRARCALKTAEFIKSWFDGHTNASKGSEGP
jgi:hypothetical protein